MIEGKDFYYKNGLMVLTREFLLKRGKCCHKGCLNCPYKKHEQKTDKNK